MNQDNYITLIYKKLKREISPDEQTSLNNWTSEREENALLQQQLEENWKASKTVLPPISVDTKKDFQGFKQRMKEHKRASDTPKQAIIKPLNSRRRLFSIAAAIAIPLAVGLWFMTQIDATTPVSIAQTSVGETKVINLSDGSTITLNENSELTYPTELAATERLVQLKGEAYFEIAKDANRPFKVNMEQTTVTVLGTVFNIRNIPSENIVTVNVEEGKVQFSNKKETQKVILTKNEIGSYNQTSQQIQEGTVNNKNASAWKSKALTYKNTPLQTVMKDLTKHFNVKVTISNEKMTACPMSGRFAKATPKMILDYIVDLYQMELREIDDQTFELKNGICK